MGGDLEDLGREIERIMSSGLFDLVFYQRQVKAQFADIEMAIADFLHRGSAAGLDPCASFSTTDYMRQNKDVTARGTVPLVHFLSHGLDEGRFRVPTSQKPRKEPKGGTMGDLTQVRSARPEVTIVIPVYADADLTINCIRSVLTARNKTVFTVHAVYDAGPDPQLEAKLRELAEHHYIKLAINATNLGFVGTSNKGLAFADDTDVIILNSDTEVHGDWIDRLRAIACSDNSIASITPFSNNATIASYPFFARDNWTQLEIGDEDLDTICSSLFAGAQVEMPVGVGFCMYMTAAALRLLGPFDADIFGRGYGEEVDWCRRAVERGFKNVLAPGVFVTHFGGSSFGSYEKRAREIEAGEKLELLHPGYRNLIHQFISEDPIKFYREQIDLARLVRSIGSPRPKAVLLVCPKWPGGTERHVRELSDMMRADGYAILRCQPAPGDPNCLSLTIADDIDLPNLSRFDMSHGPKAFAKFLKALGIAFIHVHHILELPAEGRQYLVAIARELDIPFYVTLHDYLLVCPQITMVDWSGFYCGEPEVSVCETCVSRKSTRIGKPYVWNWLQENLQFLSAAKSVFVPNVDVLTRMRRHLPGPHYVVREHHPVATGETTPTPIGLLQSEHVRKRLEARQAAEQPPRKRIAVIGSIGPEKGSGVLLQFARELSARKAPVDIVVIGFTDIDYSLNHCKNVTMTGAYYDGDLDFLIARIAPDLIWFPVVWPETFSYTLSHALAYGAPIACFDIGAIPQRTPAELLVRLPLHAMLYPELIASVLLASLEEERALRPHRQMPELFHTNTEEYFEGDDGADQMGEAAGDQPP